MANPEHLAILKQGVEVWNKWIKTNYDVHPDLSEVNLSKINLRMAILSKTNLSRAKLLESDLSRAYL